MKTEIFLFVLLGLHAVESSASVLVQDQAMATQLRENGQKFETDNVALWIEQEILSPLQAQAALRMFDQGIEEIEEKFGLSLDTDHYSEDKVQIFVARGVRTSHVFGGYEHMRYDKPYLYLNSYRLLQGKAPYLHELTHLLAWRLGSHSLREGFASVVELDVSAAGTGTSSGLFGMTNVAVASERARETLLTPVGQSVLPWIGRNGSTDPLMTSPDNPESREAFYLLSQSYVRYLVQSIGLREFLTIYAAEDPEASLHRASGRDRDAWIMAWQNALRQ